MMTAEQMIAALGGTVEVARAVKAPPSTVSSWKKAGTIPHWRMPSIERVAKLKGISLDVLPDRAAPTPTERAA